MKKTTLYFLLTTLVCALQANPLHVKSSGSDDNDGSNWKNAVASISKALTLATSGDEIWVAQGCYKAATYSLTVANSGVDVYGGFVGNETERVTNPDPSLTVLSPLDSEKAKQILVTSNTLTSLTHWSGFTFTGCTTVAAKGGAISMDSNFKLTNSIICNNSSTADGGGVWMNKSAIMDRCIIADNSTTASGGGIRINGNDVGTTISNCLIYNNTSGNNGGGIGAANSCFKIVNCVIANNTLTNKGNGGGLGLGTNNGGIAEIINCTIVRNQSLRTTDACGGVYSSANGAAAPKLYNCIIWGNDAIVGAKNIGKFEDDATVSPVQNCAIEELIPVSSPYKHPTNVNLVAENTDKAGPNFVNPSATAGVAIEEYVTNWAVSDASPLIDKGNNTLLNAALYPLDILGHNRFLRTVDLGAYENQTANPVALTSVSASGCNLFVKGHTLHITALSAPVRIYSIVGKIVFEQNAELSYTQIDLPKGQYLVSSDGRVVKIII